MTPKIYIPIALLVLVGGGIVYAEFFRDASNDIIKIESSQTSGTSTPNNTEEIITAEADVDVSTTTTPIIGNGTENFTCETNKPAIHITAPDSSKTYRVGEKITIEWTTCNLSSSSWIGLAAGDIVMTTKLPSTKNSFMYTIEDFYCGPWGSDTCQRTSGLKGKILKLEARVYEDTGPNTCMGFCPTGTTRPKFITSYTTDYGIKVE